MARGPHRAARRGEGDDPRARRAERQAARAADGRGREGLRLPGPGRRRRPRRPVRGPPPADRPPLHVRPGAGTTAARAAPPAPTRSRRACSSTCTPATRRFACVSRAPLEKLERYKAQQGLDVPVVLVVRQRLQLRLPRHDRRVGRRRSSSTSARWPSSRHAASGLRSRPSSRSSSRAAAASCATATTCSTRTRTYARGAESTGGSYYFLDLTALGRQEEWEEPKGRAASAHAASPDFAA